MAWQSPKINWRAEDYFALEPDWQRITGNLRALAERCRPIYGEVALAEMASPDYAALPYAELLQAVEDNTEALRQMAPAGERLPKKRKIEENGPVWSWEDLNRLEGNAARLMVLAEGAAANRPVLSFVLGGGAFAQGI